MGMASRIREPIQFQENWLQATEALRTGWESLRTVFSSWGIVDHEHLSRWLGEHGFPATQPGNHISARAQEAVLNESCRFDVRVALVEVVCVNVAIHMGRELYPQQHREEVPRQVRQPRNARAPESSWSQLDEFDLADVFATRVPTFRKCPPSFATEAASGFLHRIERASPGKIGRFDPVHVVAQTPRRWVSWKERIGAKVSGLSARSLG